MMIIITIIVGFKAAIRFMYSHPKLKPTGYGLDDRGFGVQVPVGSRIFSSPRRPDRLWGPPNLLIQWVQGGSFPGGKEAEA
jgi:hypothetical protein